MKSKNVQIFCFLVLMISIFSAACKGSSDSGTPEAASLAMRGISGSAVNMNGTWKGCDHSAAGQQDTLRTQTFNGGSINFTLNAWITATTANCLQTTPPDAVIAGTATATLGAEATATWTNESGSTSPPTGIAVSAKASKATLAFSSVTFTPGSDLVVNNLNAIARCGKTDWAKGVATDILNCTALMPSTTQTDYWVVDDSATTLKLYTQLSATAPFQVDNVYPLLK